MSEQAKARQEACCNASETEYFSARPQIDTLMQRHNFCAGFYRGYAAALVAAPSQERIQALELEVRQQSKEIAALRGGGAAKEYAELPVWIIIEGAYYRIPNNILESIKVFADATHALRIQQPSPTPQADSQPAPVADNLRALFREALAWGMTYGPEIPAHQWDEMRESMVEQYVSRAARAPADSVLEDAARLERERICAAIKAEDDHCVENGDYMLDSNDCINIMHAKWVRKQGGA